MGFRSIAAVRVQKRAIGLCRIFSRRDSSRKEGTAHLGNPDYEGFDKVARFGDGIVRDYIVA